MIQYISALILHIQRRLEGERGAVISVKTRHVCEEDRRCGRAVHKLMASLVERGLAKQHKRGVFLIEKRDVEEVLKILKKQYNSFHSRRNSTTRFRRGGVRRAAE